ncbi:group-specific protein [Mesobacillus subterraneus]|uniref:group-specific protein n=1 Tax=Mesobacillus subterraneus TaxID=285983 RepID=UPI001CFE5887|nr:group-specific protein [Mesobacillus subterraneus]WLR57368.1 group-specific protein [Mesobacillus subterraneus]
MPDSQEEYHTGFEMEVNAPYSLNYLMTIQNIYLNSKYKESERPSFPYVDRSKWGLLGEEFEETFAEVWDASVKKNSQDHMYDHNGVLQVDKEIYQKLFQNNETGSFGYSESVKFFLAWWNGFHGKIAIEAVFDHDKMEKVYKELAASVKFDKRLRIHLVYDKPVLAGRSERAWYEVVAIEEVFIRNKHPELLSKLLKSCQDI